MKLSKVEKTRVVRTAKKTVKAKAKRIIKVRASARKSESIKAFAHWERASSPYFGVTGNVRGVLICAAFVVAGFAKLNKSNIGKGAKGNKKLFVALVGSTPWNYHRSNARITDDGLTAGGMVWFQARIADKAARDLTASLVTAMQKGGKVEGLNFHREVAG